MVEVYPPEPSGTRVRLLTTPNPGTPAGGDRTQPPTPSHGPVAMIVDGSSASDLETPRVVMTRFVSDDAYVPAADAGAGTVVAGVAGTVVSGTVVSGAAVVGDAVVTGTGVVAVVVAVARAIDDVVADGTVVGTAVVVAAAASLAGAGE